MNINNILNNSIPEINENCSVICKMTPAVFDGVTKVLKLFEESKSINIKESQICQTIKNGCAILSADLSTLVENEPINLTIVNPKKYLKLFKNIRGNNDIYFIDDPDFNRIIITNKNMKIYVPKQIEETIEIVELPELEKADIIGKNIVIDKEVRNSIKTLIDENEFANLLIKDNQMKGIYVPETALVVFDDYANESINESDCDMLLKTFVFLFTPAEKYDLYLGKLDNKHWLVTTCDTGIIEINMFEMLTVYSEEILI